MTDKLLADIKGQLFIIVAELGVLIGVVFIGVILK